MERSREVITCSEEEVPIETVKSEYERMSKRRKEMSPKKNMKIKVLETNKRIANNPFLGKFRDTVNKMYPVKPEIRGVWRRGWQSLEEGKRVMKEQVEKKVKATSLENEEKVRIVKKFIQEMTNHEIPEWSNAIEMIIGNGSVATSIIIQLTFEDVQIISNNKTNVIERVSNQVLKKRVFPVLGKEEKEEVLVFTTMVGKHEEGLYILLKDSALLTNDNTHATYKILEINAIRFEVRSPEEMERMYKVRKECLKRVIEEIENSSGNSAGLRELMYCAVLSERLYCKKKEIEKEMEEEGIYVIMQAQRRENLIRYKPENIPKESNMIMESILPY